MKSFHTIAVPHQDILDGKLGMDVFAADLWDAHLRRGSDEYKDPKIFFKKTYVTQGLSNLLAIIEKRLTGKGGDPVIQIQTPFGGGKTHTLIALYHKATEWKAKPVVIVGTKMSPKQTVWGMIEEQLTGKVQKMAGDVSPGGEVLRSVLDTNQPVIVLMDEILEYLTKAAGVKVLDSTLAQQTLAFMQELTEVAGTLEKVCVVITLPSSRLEHLDENLFQQLQKKIGRTEKVYTPVHEDEITGVIRRRLFASIDEQSAAAVVESYLEYADKEGILPAGVELSEYRTRFQDSYPFLPEVVAILYQRWGSFPMFQRTRGVLRLLSLVIYSLKDSRSSYMSLADFDLSKDDIRRELVKYIGGEYDSVIAADITNPDSGSKKVDKSIGKSIQGLQLATRASTSIFMYSFSGGQEAGANIGEIKRSATTLDNPSASVAAAVEQLKGKLFFLQNQDEKYFFSNQSNLNRILLTKMENVSDQEVSDALNALLKQQISGIRFKVYPWPAKPKDIPDGPELKLAILREKNDSFMRDILEMKGESPRVYRNTIFFLCPSESERTSFVESLKRKIAWERIQSDKTVRLSEAQRKEVAASLKHEAERLGDALRGYYRLVYEPTKAGPAEVDLGIPTFGERSTIDEETYDRLRAESKIHENLHPSILREKYLHGRESIGVAQTYEAMLRTPGERRPVSKAVFEESVRQGVKLGLFGLGELGDDAATPMCKFYKEDPYITFDDHEVIIKDSLCADQRKPQIAGQGQEKPGTESKPEGGGTSVGGGPEVKVSTMDRLDLRFTVPRGKVSGIMGMMSYLQSKFQSIEIQVKAENGSLTLDEYRNKIKEALQQLGINLED